MTPGQRTPQRRPRRWLAMTAIVAAAIAIVVLARTVADAQAVSCTVRIDLLPSGQITAHARGRQATAAVDRAADRAGWQLRRRTGQPLS